MTAAPVRNHLIHMKKIPTILRSTSCTFIIFGSVAYLGSLSLKSAVRTMGKVTRMTSVPLSVSRSTSQLYDTPIMVVMKLSSSDSFDGYV